MLTDSLLAAYQQYKQDTKHIVECLACTARSYGFRATQPASEGRLKGKARKEAKKTTKLYPVSLSDFEPMALFLVESLVLTLAGGVLGVLLGFCANHFISQYFWGGFPIPLDGRVLVFALFVTLLTGLSFAAAPAWIASNISTGDAL